MRSTARARWAAHRIRTALNFDDTGATRIRREPFRRSATGRRSAICSTTASPDKGVGVNINIPLRNRVAQADQARSQMEYRQSQMRLQQLYTQIRIQVINAQYALTNDRAQVEAAQAARDYAAQSLDAEQKKYKLGASTTANVLQQGRQPGDCGEYADLGDGGVCEGPVRRCGSYCRTRWIGTGSAFEGAATGQIDAGSGDSGADGADGTGTRRSRSRGHASEPRSSAAVGELLLRRESARASARALCFWHGSCTTWGSFALTQVTSDGFAAWL